MYQQTTTTTTKVRKVMKTNYGFPQSRKLVMKRIEFLQGIQFEASNFLFNGTGKNQDQRDRAMYLKGHTTFLLNQIYKRYPIDKNEYSKEVKNISPKITKYQMLEALGSCPLD
ncbi:hypothetical protein BBD32_02840 [Elizabethkingia anophelis]|uniref:Uncharacterized protein n=2 Tax=Elizabethkingia anophelis TaxID=1117645 RepID=A0AAU8USQ8_9FLAO|nr:hypothetical protein BBD32_02840 [Elizabethkingia anophelis]OPB66245.1 hypothetical protein BAY11_14870 [Elizabethkingia anophelis]